MTDRELLELAAKAAGYDVKTYFGADGEIHISEKRGPWNPLTYDGDALRLAVKLQMSSLFATGFYTIEDYAISGNDPNAATRRAIVRAAAEIGKEMR